MRPLIFNMFKPQGISSYDVLRPLKKLLPKNAKLGHFGTLDPFACGVLLVGAFGAARLNDYIHQLPKTYLAVGKLGVQTASGDRTNPIINEDKSDFGRELSLWPREKLNDLIKAKFTGAYDQAPPMYSAAKFQGEPLHHWAKRGVTIVKPPVRRQIYKIEVIQFKYPWLCLRCTVSSGTYIRVLFSDIAQYLGTLGTLYALLRESIGPCTHHQACRLRPSDRWEDLAKYALAPEQILPFPKVELDAAWKDKMLHGMPVPAPVIAAQLPSASLRGPYLWPCYQHQIIALAQRQTQQSQDVWAPKIVWPLENGAKNNG